MREERWKHIEILSDLRAKYSCFEEGEEPYYKALSAGIKALKQEPCVTMRDLSEEELKHFAEEMKKVRPQVIEQEPKWIPVSERLPKAGEYVGDVDKYYLVQNEYGDMLVARYTHSEYWEQIFRFQPIGDEIVAWMPLPEPYKAESEVTDADSN